MNDLQNPCYQRPNEIQLSYSFFKYLNELEKLNLLHSTTFGWLHRYHKTHYQKYITQEFKPLIIAGKEITPSYKLSWNQRFIETNCSELMQKQSLALKYYFASDSVLLNSLCRLLLRRDAELIDNKQSDLFRGFFLNPENYAYLKMS